MRVLVVVAHYFHPEPDPRHSALNAARRGERETAVRRVLTTWRHLFGDDRAVLNIEKRAYETISPHVDTVTICALTTQGRHLLDAEFCKRHRIMLIERNVDNPRYLGFEAASLFADARHRFDLFVYSEDDLLVQDPMFLHKIRWFGQRFGYRRLLMPNRFEWNLTGPAVKTYIDGDVRRGAYETWSSPLPDEEFLAANALADRAVFRRARNPHSGMHVLSHEQLTYWIDRPYWNDRDAAFIGPLESAATLGVLKTFPIYKPFGRSASFLEIEHLDRTFSSLARVSPAGPAKEAGKE
jgi:hypothetical protein